MTYYLSVEGSSHPLTKPANTYGARMLQQLRPMLPEYHIQEMRAEFSHQSANLGINIPPHIRKFIYAQLSFDFKADTNPVIDE